MKVLKKFASIIIAVCLMIPVLSTVVFAADGVLMFSDPYNESRRECER